MKTVFSNDMVAHVWAQASQDEGRSNNGNFYFTGRKLYSYGSHFIVGIVMPDGTALLNLDSYSISTGRHQAYAWRAVRSSYHHISRLTDIASSLLAANPDKATIRRIVAERLPAMDDETATYLLGLVGQVRSLPKLRREADERVAKAARDAEKAKRIAARAVLDQFTAGDSVRFRLWLASQIGDYASAMAVVEREAKAVRSAQRILGKAGVPPKLWTASQARLKLAFALVPTLESGRSAHGHRVTLRRHIRQYRNAKMAAANAQTAYMDSPVAAARALNDVHYAVSSIASALAYLGNTNRYLNEVTKAKALAASDLLSDASREMSRRADELRNAEIEAERFRRAASEADSRAAWFAGEPSQWYGQTPAGSAYVRAVHVLRNDAGEITGGTLETSQRAVVPLVHAIRAFRFVKLCRDTGREWNANGKTIPVGHFRIDRIAPTGDFVAGCHRIQWPEIEALARELGVAGIAGDDSALVSRAA